MRLGGGTLIYRASQGTHLVEKHYSEGVLVKIKNKKEVVGSGNIIVLSCSRKNKQNPFCF